MSEGKFFYLFFVVFAFGNNTNLPFPFYFFRNKSFFAFGNETNVPFPFFCLGRELAKVKCFFYRFSSFSLFLLLGTILTFLFLFISLGTSQVRVLDWNW